MAVTLASSLLRLLVISLTLSLKSPSLAKMLEMVERVSWQTAFSPSQRSWCQRYKTTFSLSLKLMQTKLDS